MRITIDIDPRDQSTGAAAAGSTPDVPMAPASGPHAAAPAELLARAAAMNAHDAGPAPDLSLPAEASSRRAPAPGHAAGGATHCSVAAAEFDGITNGGAAALGEA